MQPPLTHKLLGADLRALALFRMALGTLCLYDLVNRAFNLTAHYTDAGVLPRTTLLPRAPQLLSLHYFSGDWAGQAFLFALAAAASVCLIMGARTFWSTVTLFVLTVSLQNRNPMLIYGADVLLRALLFWSLFLPLAACWSWDRRVGREPAPPRDTILAGGTIALLLQIIIVYVFTGLLKTGPAWFDGSAVHNALQIDNMARPMAAWWLEHPHWLRHLTPIVRLFEIYGPVLLLCPIWPTATRLIALIAFVGLHVGLGTTLDLGLWPWCAVAALIPLLPSRVFGTARSPAAMPERPPEDSAPPSPTVRSSVSRCRHPVVSGLAVAWMAYVLWWNIDTLPNTPLAMPGAIRNVGSSLRLDQHWNMFAPEPMTDDGWFVIEGTLSDGTQIDPLTGTEPHFDKPSLAFHRDLNDRWQKYYHNLWLSDYAWAVRDYARWMCRSWNPPRHDGAGLQSFDLYYMLEDTTLGTGTLFPVEDVLIWEQTCPKEAP